MHYGFIEENGEVYGVSLGYDFCAEHETGIDTLRDYLRLPQLSRRNIGLPSRTAKVDHVRRLLKFDDKEGYSLMYLPDIPDETEYVMDGQTVSNDGIVTAWCENKLAVMANTPESISMLKSIYNQFINNGMTIAFVTTGNPFARTSLALLVPNKIPSHHIDAMEQLDKNTLVVNRSRNKLNLHDKIVRSRKLSNVSVSYEVNKENVNTEYDVIVWVRSMEMHGWFRVEDVLQFIKDDVSIEEMSKRRIHGH